MTKFVLLSILINLFLPNLSPAATIAELYGIFPGTILKGPSGNVGTVTHIDSNGQIYTNNIFITGHNKQARNWITLKEITSVVIHEIKGISAGMTIRGPNGRSGKVVRVWSPRNPGGEGTIETNSQVIAMDLNYKIVDWRDWLTPAEVAATAVTEIHGLRTGMRIRGPEGKTGQIEALWSDGRIDTRLNITPDDFIGLPELVYPNTSYSLSYDEVAAHEISELYGLSKSTRINLGNGQSSEVRTLWSTHEIELTDDLKLRDGTFQKFLYPTDLRRSHGRMFLSDKMAELVAPPTPLEPSNASRVAIASTYKARTERSFARRLVGRFCDWMYVVGL